MITRKAYSDRCSNELIIVVRWKRHKTLLKTCNMSDDAYGNPWKYVVTASTQHQP